MEYLDFEKPIQELEEQLTKCLIIGKESDVDVSETCEQIEIKLIQTKKDIFKKELEKAVNRLLPFEVKELFLWLREFTLNKPELHVCLSSVKYKKGSF